MELLQVEIPQEGGAVVHGDALVPDGAEGIVVFAHGSGSSRHSTRNRRVATSLNERGLATLLMDLLTPDEEQADLRTAHLRFDIALLARRLVGAADWLGRQTWSSDLRIGYFGASTGGGAALVAAAHQPDRIGAVVSRGGRPDLAGDALPDVAAPTLLIVGGQDHAVIEMNRDAYAQLQCKKELEIVPGATHLFEEPGTMEAVADLAGEWFVGHLSGSGSDPGVATGTGVRNDEG